VPDEEVPVLVVGGSLVGLTSALLLAQHGVRSLAVEHHRGTAIHPRAAQICQRAMEILRSVGIEQIALQKSEEQFVQDGAVMAVETLAGRELAWYVPNLNEGIRDVSPTVRVFLTQNLLEPLLQARAEAFGAELRFGTDMISLEEGSDGITAVIRDRESQKTSTVHAHYLIGADGTHSRIRQALGIGMRGRGVLSRSVTIYFRGKVGHLLRGRNLSVIYISNSQLTGFFRIEKPFESGFLAVNSVGPPDAPNPDVWTGLTEERSQDLIRASLGVDDVPLTIESVMKWEATADSAERYRQGRVFLAGDSAHSMPPTGGFGGNTGMQDAHNLAWKLALVLRSAAGPDLLSTYDAERRPIGAFTTEQAYSRYVTRWSPHLLVRGIEPIASDLDIDLGYRYRSAAVIPEAEDDGRLLEPSRETKGRPGTRAPHFWLKRDGRAISTLDLFGPGFTLLAGLEGQAWSAAAGKLGTELQAHVMPEPEFPAAYGITPSGAVLVRPDGIIGWRVRTAGADPEATISRALEKLLCRSAGAARS
jgi:2-polyprenyl-6-methoxyphenol hydroxylase-like FAD-dependent oxidoreductase